LRRDYVALMWIAALLLVACGTPAPTPTPSPVPTPTPGCPADGAAEYLNEWGRITAEWDDLIELAGSTPRVNLPPLVQQMQGLRREQVGLDAPCAEAEALTEASVEQMDAIIEGYLAFIRQESDSTVEQHFGRARQAAPKIGRAYQALDAFQ